MRRVATKSGSRLALGAMLALASATLARAQDATDPPTRAARVSFVDGAVSLQPAGSDGWIGELLNQPLTTGDRLWSDADSRAEVELGSTAVRLGADTGVELLNVDDQTLQLKLASGTLGLRVRSLGRDQNVEIDTPLAALTVLAPGEYRIDLDEVANLMRVEALSGQIAATAGRDAASLHAGEQATYSDQGLSYAGVAALPPGDAFDQWAAERDRREDRAASAQFLSRETTGYEDLDEYGTWQTVETYGPVWVPVVAVSWAPYRNGHWAWVGPWGWTWVDAAPWGFAPFHYGRWLFLGERWCWAPGPRRGAPSYAPALVGWVGNGPGLGWFPLGWNEVYVPGYRSSEHYVRQLNLTNLHVSNEYMSTYLASHAAEPTPQRKVPFRNQAVPGAISATTRAAFASAQPVEMHPAEGPREAFAHLAAAGAPPPIVPTAQSAGRPPPSVPGVDAQFWHQPVLARSVPPPAPPSFEQQRRAVAANGGIAPGLRRGGSPRTDIVRASPPTDAPVRPVAARTPGATRPAGPPATAPVRSVAASAPPRAPAADRPPPERPPEASGREAPPARAPAPRPAEREAPRPAARPARPSEPHARAEPKGAR